MEKEKIPNDIFKEEIELEQGSNLEILANARPDIAQIVKENPDIFGFAIKKEKKKDPTTGQEKEVERRYIKVLGIELEMNEEGAGTQFSAEDFKGFSIDDKSLDLLKTMATGIKLNQPPLIEGPTDIGKSRALEFLAYLTNHYLLYQSFSGQTDVTELIGKYVPNVEDVRHRFEELLKNKKSLKPETIKIIQQLENDSKRETFTLEECKQIALNEVIASPEELQKLQWGWSDGTVPRAMRHDNGRGCWLYFDELGAAEPQILVKLNRIFGGNFARITITENSQNPDIQAVYPEWHSREGRLNQFRIVATTNPPSYAGREPFEKDFLRRWVYQRVGRLNAESFLSRLDFVGYGKKPEVMAPKKSGATEGINLEKASEIYHLLNLTIATFRELAQKELDSQEKERGEQEFRFDEFSDALRIQAYLKQMQGPDIIETLKDAIRFYYMGKIEGSLLFHHEVDLKEKTKTSQEKGTKLLTTKDIENVQSERVKKMEALLNEVLDGVTGPKIDRKSIKAKIEEEIKKLDPEINRKSLIEELSELKKSTSRVSKSAGDWSAVGDLADDYKKTIQEIEAMEESGKKDKDIQTGIKTLELAKKKYQKLQELASEINDRFSKKKEVENKFDSLL